MLVGVDFDNTIVCCDQLFHRAAVQKGLIPSQVPVTKGNVRDYMRRHGNENAWTELQGYVYGVLIRDAPAFPGVVRFFTRCQREGIAIRIISHKTRYPILGERYDLHKVAHGWLERRGFYDSTRIGLSRADTFFERTKQEKSRRIKQVGCSHFIDDLPEFLTEPGFPAGVERILFNPARPYSDHNRIRRATSWMEIEQWLMGTRV